MRCCLCSPQRCQCFRLCLVFHQLLREMVWLLNKTGPLCSPRVYAFFSDACRFWNSVSLSSVRERGLKEGPGEQAGSGWVEIVFEVFNAWSPFKIMNVEILMDPTLATPSSFISCHGWMSCNIPFKMPKFMVYKYSQTTFCEYVCKAIKIWFRILYTKHLFSHQIYLYHISHRITTQMEAEKKISTT